MTLEVTVGGASVAQPPPSQIDSSRASRAALTYDIRLDGTNITDYGWEGLLLSYEVSQDVSGLDRCKLRFADPEGVMASAPLLQEGVKISIALGYENLPSVPQGVFIAQAPRQTYDPRVGSTISVTGFGEEILFAQEGEKRRAFQKKKDSEIVEEIAQEYGFAVQDEFGSTVTPTDYEYPVVIQNGTDWDFIKSRAQLHGFQTFTRRGVLYWRPYQKENDGYELLFKTGEDATVEELEIRIDTFRRAPTFRKAQVNIKNGEILSHESEDEDDPLVREEGGAQKAQTVVTAGGSPRAIAHIVNQGHLQDEEETRRMLDEAAKATKWPIVELRGSSMLLEFLRANNVVKLVSPPLLRFEGEYVVKKVVHKNDSNSSDPPRSEFTLRRTFLRRPCENPDLKADEGSGQKRNQGEKFRQEVLSSGNPGVASGLVDGISQDSLVESSGISVEET